MIGSIEQVCYVAAATVVKTLRADDVFGSVVPLVSLKRPSFLPYPPRWTSVSVHRHFDEPSAWAPNEIPWPKPVRYIWANFSPLKLSLGYADITRGIFCAITKLFYASSAQGRKFIGTQTTNAREFLQYPMPLEVYKYKYMESTVGIRLDLEARVLGTCLILRKH